MDVKIEEIRDLIEAAESMADMDTLKNDVPLTEQGVDSLDMANILLLLEEKYELKIPDKDTKLLQTIDEIVTYLKYK